MRWTGELWEYAGNGEAGGLVVVWPGVGMVQGMVMAVVFGLGARMLWLMGLCYRYRRMTVVPPLFNSLCCGSHNACRPFSSTNQSRGIFVDV